MSSMVDEWAEEPRLSVAERRARRSPRRSAAVTPPPGLDLNDPVVAQALAYRLARDARSLARTARRGSPGQQRRSFAQGGSTYWATGPLVDWPVRWPAIAAQYAAQLASAHARRLTAAERAPGVETLAGGDLHVEVDGAWLRIRNRPDGTLDLCTGPAGTAVHVTADQLRTVGQALVDAADDLQNGDHP